LLELFEGRITLTELLELDVARLNGLIDAKNKILEERSAAEGNRLPSEGAPKRLTMPGDLQAIAPPN
jgi:hypothetical protein